MLKVGLIGCGFMGAMHANCYKNIEGAELVALADLRREKAEELAAGTNAVLYADGKDLIANADVDIIDICLPTYLHAEHAILAMQKVKYVFVEKPVALTKEEGKEMMEAAAKYGLPVLAKMPIDPKLAKLVDNGAIETFEGEWLNEAVEAILKK